MSKKPEKAQKVKKPFWKKQFLILALLIASIAFLPTTILLLVGMLPTIVASLIDRTKERLKGMTVGVMNFAGCFPFWLDLVLRGHKPETALAIITSPSTIIVMYAGALVGYLIEFVMTGAIAKVVTQQARSRLKKIAQQKSGLIERWGREVTGEIPLDASGFPLEESGQNEK